MAENKIEIKLAKIYKSSIENEKKLKVYLSGRNTVPMKQLWNKNL